MTKRALVLGGGGIVGIAWEVGVLAGLQRGGVGIASADLVVGTSAGSVVGTQVRLGLEAEALLAMQLAPPSRDEAAPLTIDPGAFATVTQLLTGADDPSPALLAQVGQVALTAPTVTEEQYLERFGLLAGLPWPGGALRVTAVDAETGAFHAWSGADSVPLARAVAASCAVPGIFPPVTIAGRRYMDGGMRSDTNADLAEGYGRVLIVAPIGPQSGGMGMAARSPVEHEIANLRAAGAAVELILPDEAAQRAFGPNLMDTMRRGAAAEAGARQGAALAGQVRELWG